jgi:hypothetical protein
MVQLPYRQESEHKFILVEVLKMVGKFYDACGKMYLVLMSFAFLILFTTIVTQLIRTQTIIIPFLDMPLFLRIIFWGFYLKGAYDIFFYLKKR